MRGREYTHLCRIEESWDSVCAVGMPEHFVAEAPSRQRLGIAVNDGNPDPADARHQMYW